MILDGFSYKYSCKGAFFFVLDKMGSHLGSSLIVKWIDYNTKIKKVPTNHCRLTGSGGTELAGFGRREECVAARRKIGEAEECWQPEKK